MSEFRTKAWPISGRSFLHLLFLGYYECLEDDVVQVVGKRGVSLAAGSGCPGAHYVPGEFGQNAFEEMLSSRRNRAQRQDAQQSPTSLLREPGGRMAKAAIMSVKLS